MRRAQSEPPAGIDAYIADFPPDVRELLEQVRTAIREVAPGATETIRYRIPTFFLHENLVHFAAFPNHIGFYPTPSGIATFKNELSAYNTAKGSVQFPIDKPIPLDLIRKIVKFRVEEVLAKSAAKAKR